MHRLLGIACLAALGACASDRPPLLEDDPRSRAAQRTAPLPAAAPMPAPLPDPVPVRDVPAPAAETPPAVRAPFTPRAQRTEQAVPSTNTVRGGYVPRAASIPDAPESASDAAAGLDEDPYFASDLARVGQDARSAPSVGAPARVGADATPASAADAPFALRGATAPTAPALPPEEPSARRVSRTRAGAPAGLPPATSTPTPRATASAVTPAPAAPAAAAYIANPQAVLSAVNEYRARYGYAPLSYDPTLSATAYAHAEDLARRGAVTPLAEDGGGVIDRLAARGYRAEAAASLVAGGYDAFGDAMTSWRRDRVQRSRLLLPQATSMGVARVEDATSPYRYYIEMIVATE